MPDEQHVQQESSDDVIKRIFGESIDPWDAQDEPDTSSNVVEPQTTVTPQALPEKPADPVDNDQVRYQYWQSEAMKKEAELAAIRAENERIRSAVQQPQAPPEDEDVVFPDPPQKPQPPYGYSPEEAMSDPKSESARFVGQYQKWQEDMQEYNSLKLQYIEASFQDKLDRMEQERNAAAAKQRQQEQWAQIQNEAKQDVMTKFGVDVATATDFVQFASSPESLSIENMYRMYQAVKGIPLTPKAPTPTFNQSQVAAGFPPPPTVLPSGGASTGRSEEDIILDRMLKSEQKSDW